MAGVDQEYLAKSRCPNCPRNHLPIAAVLDADGHDLKQPINFLVPVAGCWDPLSLVSTTEKLLERKSSGSCLEIQEYGRKDPLR
jgi:hypothetical protein